MPLRSGLMFGWCGPTSGTVLGMLGITDHHNHRRRVVRMNRCAAQWPLAISDLRSIDGCSRALASSWTGEPCWARRCEGNQAVFSSWPLPFCLRRYPPSEAVECQILVLQGPCVQHGHTEIRVDHARCHQWTWLTNQIAEARLHWRHEPTSIHQLSVTVDDTTRAKPTVYSCRLPSGSIYVSVP